MLLKGLTYINMYKINCDVRVLFAAIPSKCYWGYFNDTAIQAECRICYTYNAVKGTDKTCASDYLALN